MSLFLLQLLLSVSRSPYSLEDKLKVCSKQQTQNSTQLTRISNTYKQWSLVLLCLLSVLCVRISSLKAEEASIEKCVEYFTEIIEVQKMREMLQYGADEMILRYERGNLTKKELDNTLHVWYITESRLREKVTKIYDTAYAEKCFDEDINESRRTKKGNASKIQAP